jgi:hypothetical protein
MEIDLTNVESGHVFPLSQCELLIGFPRDKDRYQWQFELLKLSDQIQKELWSSGKPFTVVTSKSEILVLTHAEASEYNATQFDNAIKKMRRAYKRLMAVETTGFIDSQLQSHEKAILKQSRILAMIKNTKATLQVVAHDSGLPKRA